MRPARAQTLPITTIKWGDLIPLIGRANRALAEYGATLKRLRNPDLLLAPLTVQEAVLSSRIEGTFATLTEVLQAEAGDEPLQESTRVDIVEINNYRAALTVADDELSRRPFNLNLLLQLHRRLLTSARGYNKMPGEFRREQNYVGSRAAGVETIRFTPPSWETLKDSLSNWESYYHMDEPDPIVQLAVVHAQFEFLHPFLDGNGRLGRILVPIFLYEKKLLPRPTFYLSSFLEANRTEYIDRLQSLSSKNGWTEWCSFFLNAVISQAEANTKKADSIYELYEQLKARFLAATRSQFAIPLLDAVFLKPMFQASQLNLEGDMPSRQTLASLLNELTREGALVVRRKASGRTSQILELRELIQLAESR